MGTGRDRLRGRCRRHELGKEHERGSGSAKKARPFRLVLPQMGFGGAPLGDLYTKITDAEAEATLLAAWNAGIRYYDTAPWYGRGQSEHRIGRHLYHRSRRAIIVSTKIGRAPGAGERGNLRPRQVGRRPLIRYSLGLQLRRHHARLRGQPPAAQYECHRHPNHPLSTSGTTGRSRWSPHTSRNWRPAAIAPCPN